MRQGESLSLSCEKAILSLFVPCFVLFCFWGCCCSSPSSACSSCALSVLEADVHKRVFVGLVGPSRPVLLEQIAAMVLKSQPCIAQHHNRAGAAHFSSQNDGQRGPHHCGCPWCWQAGPLLSHRRELRAPSCTSTRLQCGAPAGPAPLLLWLFWLF